jgi:photosystem II stability/assembly factor-like uncharacterized protein
MKNTPLILRTEDACLTWQTVFQTDLMDVFEHFSFTSQSEGYANIGVVDLDHYASVGVIVKTTNGGQTWTTMSPNPWKLKRVLIPYLVAMQFINSLKGVISTYGDYRLYKTIDAGLSWSIVQNDKFMNPG